MAYKVIWSPSAVRDLRDLASYIAEFHPTAAERFAQSVFESVEYLADFPKSGRVVPELEDPRIREVIRKPCRVVYRVKSKEHSIEIVRVWHAARGIPEI